MISWLFAALLIWQAITTLAIWPWHLTYFNALAGGTENAYRDLADSNVSWGQSLKATRAYIEEHDLDDPYLSQFTYFLQPEDVYYIQARPLPPAQDAPALVPRRYNPAPGTYIISASTLHGLQGVDLEGYNWFVQREPDDIIANAMLVYEVLEPESPPTWLAQCTAPVVPLSPKQIQDGFGVDPIRITYFDCTQSWLYPSAGMDAGWYVLHAEVLASQDSFLMTQLADAQLSFEQKEYQLSPALNVYSWPGKPTLILDQVNVRAASALSLAPQAAAEGEYLMAPAHFDGPLNFLSYAISAEDAHWELLTYWYVNAVPERLFSIMAHLAGSDPASLDVADGFGIPLDQLRVGDIVVQRHTFTRPEPCQTGPCWFKVGAYWLDSMERWPISDAAPGVDALYIPLE